MKKQKLTGVLAPPRVKATLRALAGRRVVVEGYGHRMPTFVAVTGGAGAWLTPRELRRLANVVRKILR
jgi:hypothetical protein